MSSIRFAAKLHVSCVPALLFCMGVHALPMVGGLSQQASSESAPASWDKYQDCCSDAVAALSRKDYAAARNSLTGLIRSGNTSAEPHYLLAYVLLRQNLPRDSLAEYTAAAKLRTPNAEDLRNVSLDYVLLNDLPEARKWAKRSLEMQGDDAETWYDLGRIDYSSGNLEAAYDCFGRALKLLPGSVKVEDNLGLTLEGLNRPEEAIAAYRRAIASQQNAALPSEQPLLNLATLLIHRSDLNAALPLLVQAVAISPGDPKIHEQLGKLYLRQEKLPDARTEFEKAVSLAPQDAPLHFLLGQVCHRAGLNEEAKKEFAIAARLNGTHSTDQK